MHRQSYRPPAREASPPPERALLGFTRARRELERDQLTQELVVELQRLRAELRALRLVLERRAA
jgi:hypothetical protein